MGFKIKIESLKLGKINKNLDLARVLVFLLLLIFNRKKLLLLTTVQNLVARVQSSRLFPVSTCEQLSHKTDQSQQRCNLTPATLYKNWPIFVVKGVDFSRKHVSLKRLVNYTIIILGQFNYRHPVNNNSLFY